MAEFLEESSALESTTVRIAPTSTTVKGGRRRSFSALVVVGDRRGSVGLGYGKANGVPAAIEKAQKAARKQITRVVLKGGTLPHPAVGKFGASSVRLLPAAPGTGVVAGGAVRAVLEMAGVHDCLSKAYGSTTEKNLCKAVIAGLQKMRSKETIAALRGVEIETSRVDEILAMGEKYMIKPAADGRKAKAPENKVGAQQKSKQRGRRRGRGGGDEAPEPVAAESPAAPAAPEAASN